MALTTKGMFDIKVWDDIGERCNNADLVAVIDNRVQLFYPVNADDAVEKLIQVGQLLQLAYAGSRTYGTCSVHVIEVVSNYQTLVKSAVDICTKLTNVVLLAISFHKPALIYAEKGKTHKAIGSLSKCANLSTQMADLSDKMASEIEKLSNSAFKSLSLVSEKFQGSEDDRQAVIERTNKLNQYFETTKQKAIDLQQKVEEFRILEALKLKEEIEDVKARLIYGLLGPISYIASISETTTNELKVLLQNEARTVNEDIRESVENLKKIDYSNSDLYSSVACLEVSIKILDKVKNMFLNAKKFWNGVKHHAGSLKSSKTADEIRDEDILEKCHDAFVNEIKTSGLGWLASGKIYRQSALDIRKVSHGVDRTNTKLFEKRECEKLIQKMSNTLLTDIDEENEKIEDVKSDWLYEVLVNAEPLPNLDPPEEPASEQKPFNYLVNGTDETEEPMEGDA